MPRDYSKPPRSGSKPRPGGRKPGGFAKKPWERRERSSEGPGGDRPYRKPYAKRSEDGGASGGDRPYRKPYAKRSDDGGASGGDRPYRKPYARRPNDGGAGGGDRPYRKPYGEKRDFDRPRRDFGARPEFRPPRHDDELFTASGKVAEIVGPEAQGRHDILRKLWDFFRAEELIVAAEHHPKANADDWRSESDERPRRKPAGNHPDALKAKSLEGVQRRKFKDTRDR